ncbi:acyl-CoA dehydrogenase family protein [Thauera sinica]|uniref:Acyl-CoA dehydrogenase family protein n=1 Tax=Thauera sinica TaxID=2665146 RepID=A0ABW1AMU0_9RHOO|nr:acyl-CoA dehydrogenase family protein [Thauera sp. K11]ATE60696.1 acyl-CoA dehydrogenase [Thauera sp. K11]
MPSPQTLAVIDTTRPADTQPHTLAAALATEFAATAAHYDRANLFPHDNIRRLHEAGLIGHALPMELGGGGANLADALHIVRTVARGEAATALVLALQYSISSRLGHDTPGWPRAVRLEVARDIARNGSLINALRVEPELGTPVRGGVPATVARRNGDGWRVSGAKIYSTGAPGLTWMLVLAHSAEAAPRVGYWLVHRDSPGIRIVEDWDHLGLRASASHKVVFDDVPVPGTHTLELQPAGSPPVADPHGARWGGVLIPSVYDGVARAARDWLVEFSTTRVPTNLGRPLSTLPRFQEALGEIDALLLSNDRLFAGAADGSVALKQIGQLKHLVTTQAIAVVERAVQLTGNPGLTRANPLERHYRDVLCSRVHAPQSDFALSSAGAAAFAEWTDGGQR